MTWNIKKQMYKKDMFLYSVAMDNDTTYIKLRQKDNQNYNSQNNILFAVVSKEKLKENIEFDIVYP